MSAAHVPAVHVVDRVFAWLAARDPMFSSGWGDETWLAQVAVEGVDLDRCAPASIREVEGPGMVGDVRARDFVFESPRGAALALPPAVITARVRWLARAAADANAAPAKVVIVLAGSREEGYRLREAIWRPLVATGIDVLLLENPYYGTRRAAGQRSASLATVCEQMRMNLATLAEVDALVDWLSQRGCKSICVTGYSMGGAIAAMAGAYVRREIAVVPIAAGLSPAPIYTEALLSRSVNFDALGATCGGPERAREKLRALFEAASLAHASKPVRSDATIVVACTRDGYVPARESEALASHWACELRWIDAGHVSAVFTGRDRMREAVRDTLACLAARAS